MPRQAMTVRKQAFAKTKPDRKMASQPALKKKQTSKKERAGKQTDAAANEAIT